MNKLHSDSYALIIGVDDYSAYGAAVSLPGSVNDAAAWWRVCRAVGIPRENVRVLITRSLLNNGKMSEGLDKDRFRGAESVQEATKENIIKGARWLADKLKDGQVPGLFTYSGHGDVTDERGDLCLCPCDVHPKHDGGVGKLLNLHELAEALHHGHSQKLLTVVLDCCHAGGAVRAGSRPLSLRGKTDVKAKHPPLGGRELFACKHDQIAYQSQFATEFHGAFTWALTAALLQWKPIEEDGAVTINVTYERARQVSEELLRVLRYTQTPMLSPDSAADLVFFHPKTKPDKGEGSWWPDGVRIGDQLDPDWSYLLQLNNGNVVAQVVVVPANTTVYYTYNNNTAQFPVNATNSIEYWFITSTNAVLNQISSATSVGMTGTRLSTNGNTIALNGSVSTSYSSNQANVSWTWSTSSITPSPGTNTTFSATPVSPTVRNATVTAYALFNVTSKVVGGTTVYSLANVYWYLTATASWPSAPTGVQPAGSSNVTYNSTSAPTTNFYYAVSTPA